MSTLDFKEECRLQQALPFYENKQTKHHHQNHHHHQKSKLLLFFIFWVVTRPLVPSGTTFELVWSLYQLLSSIYTTE